MRVNEAAHWYPSREVAPRFLGPILERIKDLVPQHLENGLPLYPHFSEKAPCRNPMILLASCRPQASS